MTEKIYGVLSRYEGSQLIHKVYFFDNNEIAQKWLKRGGKYSKSERKLMSKEECIQFTDSEKVENAIDYMLQQTLIQLECL